MDSDETVAVVEDAVDSRYQVSRTLYYFLAILIQLRAEVLQPHIVLDAYGFELELGEAEMQVTMSKTKLTSFAVAVAESVVLPVVFSDCLRESVAKLGVEMVAVVPFDDDAYSKFDATQIEGDADVAGVVGGAVAAAGDAAVDGGDDVDVVEAVILVGVVAVVVLDL